LVLADGGPPPDGDAVLVQREKEVAMLPGGFADWIVLGSGYVLALGLFAWLGGIQRAGEAIRNWGRSSTHGAR
jgi:hypothetical protein